MTQDCILIEPNICALQEFKCSKYSSSILASVCQGHTRCIISQFLKKVHLLDAYNSFCGPINYHVKICITCQCCHINLRGTMIPSFFF
ncbi:hypothetical protein Leryth_017192, partial [Lithospermum erythrorhizon]